MSIQPTTMQTPVTTAAANTQTASTPLPERGAPAEAVSAQPVPASTPAEKKHQLEAAVKAVQDFTRPMAGNLEFSLDEETGDTVIKITDSSTHELIRQIPSVEMLEIARALDRLQGILVSQKA